MKNINYYNILGIYTNGTIVPKPIKDITDEEVLQRYLKIKNRILEKLQEKQAEKVYQHLDKEKSDKNLMVSLEELEEAFEMLKTEEKRKQYEQNCIKNAELKDEKKQDPLTKPLQGIEIKKFNVSNRALDVKEDPDHIPYTPIYEDENVQILELAKINFFNGGILKDSLYQYTMLLKKDGGYSAIGDFYTSNIINQMKDPKYREILYRAVLDINLNNKKNKYIGSIEKKDSGNYYICIDEGQQDAVKQHQKQIANTKLNNSEEKYK